MQTVYIDIADDKLDIFLTIIDNLQHGIVKGIRLQNDVLDIEPIEKNSADYKDIQETKREQNPSYSIEEVKAKLGL